MNGIPDRRIQKQRLGVALLSDAVGRHRASLILLASLLALSAIALFIFGLDYYLLSISQRHFSPKHAYLKPSSPNGLRLGIIGLTLFAMVYLYPLRKYWPAFGRVGKTRNWFDYHILLGITAPTVISFHSAFKHQGFAGMAYWTMIALVASGIIGRYFYAQIPRNISAAELTIKDMEELKTSFLDELRLQKVFRLSEIEALFRLPDSREIQSMSALQAVVRMVALDVARPFRIWAMRRRGMIAAGNTLPLRAASCPQGMRNLKRRSG